MLIGLVLSQALASAPNVDTILERAIEVQRLHEEAGNEVKYDYELLSTNEKLDNHGDVKEVEEYLYQSDHIEDVAYERLVKKDGKALTEKQLKREAKREKSFRKKLEKGEARHDDSDERVAFDADLVGRYDFELAEIRKISERTTYILTFEPKPGKLPKKQRIDAVLNKASGALWVDTETYQISRVDFSLEERVKLWWGMIGSVSRLEGTIARRPVGDDIWLPEKADIYIKGRILFRSLHMRQKVVWSDFVKRDESLATSASSRNMETR